MKMYEVKLRHAHGGNIYRRAGFTFTADRQTKYVPVPLCIPEEHLTEALRNDPNLEVTELAVKAAPAFLIAPPC